MNSNNIINTAHGNWQKAQNSSNKETHNTVKLLTKSDDKYYGVKCLCKCMKAFKLQCNNPMQLISHDRMHLCLQDMLMPFYSRLSDQTKISFSWCLNAFYSSDYFQCTFNSWTDAYLTNEVECFQIIGFIRHSLWTNWVFIFHLLNRKFNK